MQKLIELLNEYMPNMKREERRNWTEIFANIHNSDLFICYTERVISKRFGFIKWLVENDKIDTEKEIKNSELNWLHEHYFREDCLLMLLSISDTPIEDLISYLK